MPRASVACFEAVQALAVVPGNEALGDCFHLLDYLLVVSDVLEDEFAQAAAIRGGLKVGNRGRPRNLAVHPGVNVIRMLLHIATLAGDWDGRLGGLQLCCLLASHGFPKPLLQSRVARNFLNKLTHRLQHFHSTGELDLLLLRPQLRFEALCEHWRLLAHALRPTPLRLEVCDHSLCFGVRKEVVDDLDGRQARRVRTRKGLCEQKRRQEPGRSHV